MKYNLKFTIDVEDAIEAELGKPIEDLTSELSDRKILRTIAKAGLIGSGMAENMAEKGAGKITRKEVLESLFRDFGVSMARKGEGDEIPK